MKLILPFITVIVVGVVGLIITLRFGDKRHNKKHNKNHNKN